jgi:hypothetical protein
LRKVDKLSCVRIGSARYSVPVRLIGHAVEVIALDGRVKVLDADEIVADHGLVAPGAASVHDDHYGGARPDKPLRSVRPSTPAEKAFCALGPVAEVFLTKPGSFIKRLVRLAGGFSTGMRCHHGGYGASIARSGPTGRALRAVIVVIPT